MPWCGLPVIPGDDVTTAHYDDTQQDYDHCYQPR